MLDRNKNILVLSALQQELNAFIEHIDVRECRLGPFKYYHTKLECGNTVYCALSGWGKVNSASTASAFLSQEGMNIGFVINSGTAGSLSADIHKGDIVVGTHYCQHDYDLTTLFSDFKIGQMVDKDNLLDTVPSDIIDCLEQGAGIHFGTIISGDRFVSSRIEIEGTRPLAVDMESAAFAHLCYHLYKTPFLAVRAITDNADENAHEDWQSLLDRLSHNAAKYSHGVIKSLFFSKKG
jgi:adenosylhomocysteine nucleosidase